MLIVGQYVIFDNIGLIKTNLDKFMKKKSNEHLFHVGHNNQI